MAYDYKKEYKEFYLPTLNPPIVEVPPMNYIAVRGKGDPNDGGGEYRQAMNILYSVAFTIKMSKMGDTRIEGYFDYVVPPLEGLWWQELDGKAVAGFDYGDKDSMRWISLIRLPEFVTGEVFDWAKEGLSIDIDLVNRFHHEIYLNDPRKTKTEKLKTVIRYPVKKWEGLVFCSFLPVLCRLSLLAAARRNMDFAYYREIWEIMAACNTGADRIPAAFGTECRVVHKTGTGFTPGNGLPQMNDAGIVIFPDGQILAVTVFVPHPATTSELSEIVIRHSNEFLE